MLRVTQLLNDRARICKLGMVLGNDEDRSKLFRLGNKERKGR